MTPRPIPSERETIKEGAFVDQSSTRHRLTARVRLWWAMIGVAVLVSGFIVISQVRQPGLVLIGVGVGLVLLMFAVDLIHAPTRSNPQELPEEVKESIEGEQQS